MTNIFVDIPEDILFEICLNLEMNDISNLTMTSKSIAHHLDEQLNNQINIWNRLFNYYYPNILTHLPEELINKDINNKIRLISYSKVFNMSEIKIYLKGSWFEVEKIKKNNEVDTQLIKSDLIKIQSSLCKYIRKISGKIMYLKIKEPISILLLLYIKIESYIGRTKYINYDFVLGRINKIKNKYGINKLLGYIFKNYECGDYIKNIIKYKYLEVYLDKCGIEKLSEESYIYKNYLILYGNTGFSMTSSKPNAGGLFLIHKIIPDVLKYSALYHSIIHGYDIILKFMYDNWNIDFINEFLNNKVDLLIRNGGINNRCINILMYNLSSNFNEKYKNILLEKFHSLYSNDKHNTYIDNKYNNEYIKYVILEKINIIDINNCIHDYNSIHDKIIDIINYAIKNSKYLHLLFTKSNIKIINYIVKYKPKDILNVYNIKLFIKNKINIDHIYFYYFIDNNIIDEILESELNIEYDSLIKYRYRILYKINNNHDNIIKILQYKVTNKDKHKYILDNKYKDKDSYKIIDIFLSDTNFKYDFNYNKCELLRLYKFYIYNGIDIKDILCNKLIYENKIQLFIYSCTYFSSVKLNNTELIIYEKYIDIFINDESFNYNTYEDIIKQCILSNKNCNEYDMKKILHKFKY